ncbi:FAD linked oxidase N-terminal [Penicillium paradoxum]|uniref:FAD linked oxidase N-terminal n=1 Tax=Penicillium paradoxum TaxID=176176 RepID=UPI002546A880|nr:FAD linked oxidase N-terminal [Penicillium paradoxum]KAJ5778831.1 FAD linked oxidase N-terminal [Penicillium paradoxum]
MKWSLASLVALGASAVALECHCLPTDSCWPAPSVWDSLNKTVDGRLIATVPIGSPCHAPNYDAVACATLKADWYTPEPHWDSSSSVMQTYFANQSCDPFADKSQPCRLGNYVSYAVNVSSNDQVIAAVNFARENNVRFVIRNTGHDYLGRSTGAGALSVWTHHWNDIEYKDWSEPAYQGPAFKVAPGVVGFQILEAAAAKGLVVVTGECPSVGLAGGYTQGGGHSALSTQFGLAADNTLEFEVVTAAGKLVTASRSENADLFWALSGGGAGNYGVVTSLTVKAHKDAPIAGAALQFTAANISTDTFYEAVSQLHSLVPAMVDQGVNVIYQMTSQFFLIAPVTGYNKTTDEVKAILSPFMSELTNLGIKYDASFTQYDSYRDHYNRYMGPLPWGNLGVASYQYGGRLIPRQTLEENPTGIGSVLRNFTQSGLVAVGVCLNVSSPVNVSNAVSPAFRNAAITMQFGTHWDDTASWSEMVEDQYKITNEFVPQLEALTPGSGCYQNEANFRQPNWKETFFGSNYETLLDVKRRWDPSSFFYALKAVGSDDWSVSESGRMCRV